MLVQLAAGEVAREILDLAKKVEGNARHVGVHAAGIVMAPTPVTDYSPIQLDPKGGNLLCRVTPPGGVIWQIRRQVELLSPPLRVPDFSVTTDG